jgi:hypothetical protein
VEEHLDFGSKDMPYIEEEQEELGAMGGFEDMCTEDKLEGESDSLLGKMKSYCPILFSKLSLWERDYLVKSVSYTVIHGLHLENMGNVVDKVSHILVKSGPPCLRLLIASDVSAPLHLRFLPPWI